MAEKKTRVFQCAKCGIEVQTIHGRTKFCASCRAHKGVRGAMSGEELSTARASGAKRTAAYRERKAGKTGQVASQVELKPKAAREILEARGITNPRVLDVCVEHALFAARNLRILFNRHLLEFGVQGTLAAREGKQAEAPPTTSEWQAGERVRPHELRAMWDYAASWRKQTTVENFGETLSFEQWAGMRRRSITDTVWFANEVLGKSFEEEPHGRWARDLFPQLEPALLSLPEKFGQKDIAKAFQAISDIKVRCLISARSSFKSTFSTVFALQMMLCFAGSLRMMIVTATQPLAKAFAKGFRNMLTLRDPNNAPLFAQLWPEHFVAPDEGKALEYTSPFRQLDMLLEPTLGALSVISEGSAGFRYDYGIFDDCAEISNSSNVEMRASTQTRVDMLKELGEPHCLTTFVGTPISPGEGTMEDPGDLYSVLLMREAKNQKEGGEPKLLSTICPAWTVKAGIKKKAWDTTLKEDEVDLLFPNRLTFKYVMSKLKESLATDSKAKIFRQQSLVSWVPDIEDDNLRCAFDHDELWDKVRVGSYFGAPAVSKTLLIFDRGWSISKYADFSCGIIGSVQVVNGKMAVVIKDIRLIRERESGVVKMICDLIQKWQPSVFVSQNDRGFADLADAIRVGCLRRGVATPWLRSIPIDSGDRAKARRVKMLENPISLDHVFFVDGIADLEIALGQLENFDGVTSSNSTRKDDFPDTLAILWSQSGIRLAQEVKIETDPKEERLKQQENEKMFEQERRLAMHKAMYGSASIPKPPEPAPEPAPQPRTQFPRAGNFAVLPSAFRTNKR